MKNKVEIRIAALRRSGQHGIINWIASQAAGTEPGNGRSLTGDRTAKITFLNDVRPGADPFTNCNGRNIFDAALRRRLAGRKQVRPAVLDWLIYNYEDRRLEEIFSANFEIQHDMFFGSSNRRIDVIILRDAFNFFASRLRLKGISRYRNTDADFEQSVFLWKSYAHEFLDHTEVLKHNKTTINYNRWHFDREYRAGVAKSLGLNFTDAGLQSVLHCHWGGSSFDGMRFNGNAERMPVHERWKKMACHRRYQGIFEDRELVDLSEEIFGHLEGTEDLTQYSKRIISLPRTVGRHYRGIRVIDEK